MGAAIPSDPWLISIEDNVKVAYGVQFITHDIFYTMFTDSSLYKGKYNAFYGTIEVGNDVYIGGNPAKIIGKTFELAKFGAAKQGEINWTMDTLRSEAEEFFWKTEEIFKK